MSRSSFNAFWVPRIGEGAAAELRRDRFIRPITTVCLIGACAAFVALLLDGSTPDVALAVVALVVAGAAIETQRRSLVRLAAAFSHSFGIDIRLREMPPTRPKTFDAWCKDHGLHSRVGAPDT